MHSNLPTDEQKNKWIDDFRLQLFLFPWLFLFLLRFFEFMVLESILFGSFGSFNWHFWSYLISTLNVLSLFSYLVYSYQLEYYLIYFSLISINSNFQMDKFQTWFIAFSFHITVSIISNLCFIHSIVI